MDKYAVLVLILSILVIVTNIIVEVIKGLKLPTKLLTTIVAIILSVGSWLAYCAMFKIDVVWYTVAASVIMGFVVAYGAMYGFDNLYGQLLDKLKELLGGNKKEE